MTTIIPWPSGVPSCVMPMSPQGGLRDNRLSFETDNAVSPVERPRTSWAPELYQVTMVPMDRAMFQAFQSWFRGPLAYGSLPFVMDHPITREPTVWRIVKGDPPYQVSKVLAMRSADVRGISVSFGIQSMPLAVPFDPLWLFASGEQGAWFDLSDLSLMYQDHLGATPSVVGQPVGLVLDRSQGQPGPQLGNMDLKPSDFTISGGSVVITDLGDRLRLTRTAAAAGGTQAECRSLPVQAGKTYEAEFRLLAVGGDSTVRSYSSINNGGATDFAGFGYQASDSTNRRITVATGAGSGTLHLRLGVARGTNPSASVEGDWIEIAKTYSVREMPGNHARQATATARPTLMQSGAVPYLYRDPVDDALPWTAPAGSYDIVHIPLTGPATVLTEQALSGSTNILLAENTRAYLAIDRRLTGAEIDALTAYYGASA